MKLSPFLNSGQYRKYRRGTTSLWFSVGIVSFSYKVDNCDEVLLPSLESIFWYNSLHSSIRFHDSVDSPGMDSIGRRKPLLFCIRSLCWCVTLYYLYNMFLILNRNLWLTDIESILIRVCSANKTLKRNAANYFAKLDAYSMLKDNMTTSI